MRIELSTLFLKKLFWEDEMFSFLRAKNSSDSLNIASSRLYDQETFYRAFLDDLRSAKQRVVIESPFITMRRLNTLLPTLRQLQTKGVRILINTKPLHEHDELLYVQAMEAITVLQGIDITVLMTVGHHRKIAVIDDVLWEGSLNILSQSDSCEFMRRMQSAELVAQMLRFTGLHKWGGVL